MTKAKTKESTELVVLTAEEQAYAAKVAASLPPAGDYVGPKKLMINTQAKDAEGNRRPIGGWHIQGTDKYYDGAIKFRPVAFYNKLVRYNVDGNNNYTMAGQSIYFKDWAENIIDSLGTTNLGRKFGKVYTEEEKEATRKLAEWYVDIFGFVSFGESVPEPVMYRVRGTKIKTMMNAFRSVPKGKLFSEYAYTIETDQPEGKTYWDIKVSPDLSTRLPISDIISFDKEIDTFVQETNRYVVSEHNKHKVKLIEDGLVEATATVIDDELPF